MFRSDAKKYVRYAGNIVMILSLVFIIRRFVKYRDAFAEAFSIRLLCLIAGSAVVYGVIVVINAILFIRLIRRLTGKQIPVPGASLLYAKANLYKYLPGNVMHLIGRNQIASEYDIKHRTVAAATAMELAMTCIGSAIVSVVFSAGFVIRWMQGKESYIAAIAVLGVVLIAVAFFLVRKRKTEVRQFLSRTFSRKVYNILTVILLFTIVSQILGGLLFLLLLGQLQGGAVLHTSALRFVGVYSFSWLIGFVTPGAPGGLGIRELMLTVILQGEVLESTITLAVTINRIITILGDILGLLFVWMLRFRKAGPQDHPAP